MNFGYSVRPRADRDIDEIADGLTDRAGLDVGLSFLSEVQRTFALIATQPNIGWHSKVSHPQLTTARTFRVSEPFTDYLIFYQPFEGHIEILRVVHGARLLNALFAKDDAFD